MHSTIEDETCWEMQWGSKIIFNHGNNVSRGVAILFSQKIMNRIKISSVETDSDGQCIITKLHIDDTHVTLINLYVPNRDDVEFYEILQQKLVLSNSCEIIMLGDYNLVLNPNLDCNENIQYHPKSHEKLTQIIEDFKLLDLWRCQNPDKRMYSWFKKQGSTVTGSRLDFALISAGVANSVNDIQYTYGYKTDHSIVEVYVTTSKHKRGPGYWKFNSKLLYDKKFVDKTNSIIATCENDYLNKTEQECWEICKLQVTEWA